MKRPVPVVSDEPIIEYDETWDGVSIFLFIFYLAKKLAVARHKLVCSELIYG